MAILNNPMGALAWVNQAGGYSGGGAVAAASGTGAVALASTVSGPFDGTIVEITPPGGLFNARRACTDSECKEWGTNCATHCGVLGKDPKPTCVYDRQVGCKKTCECIESTVPVIVTA